LERKLKKAAKTSTKQQRQVAPLVRGPLNSKAKGELGELAFALKAATLGFGVAIPHGDNERYDFIVDSGERFWRVQVKTICQVHGHLYQTSVSHGHGVGTKPYKATEIDFVAAYLALPDIWYVIPVRCVAGSINMLLSFRMQAGRWPLRTLSRGLASHGAGRRLDATTGDIAAGSRHGL
jgi:hypothetical protein